MWTFNLVFGKIFDFIFFAFRSLSPWVGMVVISFLTGIFMLIIYRYTSNQEGIKRIKNKIKAHLLELRLFKDSLRATFQAQGNLFLSTFKYMSLNLVPLLFMIVPIILILIQCNFWFGYESLDVGNTALLKVKLTEEMNVLDVDVSVEAAAGVVLDTPPLRIEEEKEIDWRIRAEEQGFHDLIIHIDDQKIIKTVAVEGKPLTKISPIKIQRSFLDELLYPMEAPIGKNIPVKSVELTYPLQYMNFFGWNMHWIIAYFILSIIFGFAFKGVFKVEL
jgi:uncharacterized membrane protein (DUF106 family)